MKNVVIDIVGTQRDEAGEEARIEFMSVGSLQEKNGIFYVTYRESEVSGLEGATTLLKLSADKLVLVRCGAVEQKQEFSSGCRYTGPYTTPYGTLKMGVATRTLQVEFGPGTICAVVTYDLEINDEWQSYNTLSVKIREEISHEREGITR